MHDYETEEICKLIKDYPNLAESYIPVEKVGEGTFSTVFKAIDVKYRNYENDSWREFSLQDPEDCNLIDINHLQKKAKSKLSLVDKCILDYAEKFGHTFRPHFVALKRLNSTNGPERMMDEINFLYKIGGKNNVAPLITAFRHEDKVLMVLPFFRHDEYRDYLGDMTLEQIKDYMKNLLIAVAHIHSFDVIHRDLKPTNFLYNVENKRGLLVDFGLAQNVDWDRIKRYSEKSETVEKENLDSENIPRKVRKPVPIKSVSNIRGSQSIYNKVSVNQRFVFTNYSVSKTIGKTSTPREPGYIVNDTRPSHRAPRAGTRGFRAPEVLFKSPIQTTAIDVWSCGVIFLSLLTMQYPIFSSPDDMDALCEISVIFGSKEMSKIAKKYGI